MRRLIVTVGLVVSMSAPAIAQVPNMKATVEDVFAAGKWNLGTKPENGCFTEAVAFRLHQIDPNWGHLRKFRETWWNGHAADAVLHKSGYAVDIIGHSDDPSEAKPSWTIDRSGTTKKPIARYSDAEKYFIVPTGSCSPDQPDGPTPPVEPLPPTVDVAALIAALQRRVDAIDQRLAEGALQHLEIKAEVSHAWEDITRMLAALPPQSAEPSPVAIPCLRGRVLGQSITLCPVE